MAEVQFYFSIFSFTKLKKVELRNFLQDPRVDTSNCFIFVNGEKITTRNLIEEVRKEVARSKFRIIILHDESTLEDKLVEELLDLDTSTRNNTLLIIVPPRENENAPREDQNENAPREDQNENAPREDQNENAPREDQNENAPLEDQNENAPREEQKEKSYNTKYISSYDEIGKLVLRSILDFKEFNQSEDKQIISTESTQKAVEFQLSASFPIKPRGSMHGMTTRQSNEQEECEKQGQKVEQALRLGKSVGKKKNQASLVKELVKKVGPDGKCGIALAVGALLFAVFYQLFFLLYPSPTTTVSNEISIVDKFTSRIKELKSEMVDQDEKLWRVLRSMKHHINDSNPRQPAVLMLVSTKKASENREYLAREIAEVYSARCSNADYVMVNGVDYTNMNVDDAKLKVDEKIIEKFSAGSCATIISNFEKLPPASTKIFYQFCENDNAPYKNVIVIFTLEIEDGPWDEDDYISAGEESTPKSKNWNEIVDQYLHYSLKTRDKTETMNIDMISPLLSRITPAVAWVGSK